MSRKFMKESFTPIRSVLAEAFERIDMLHRERGKLRGIPTGFVGVDNLLAGLQKSDLVILAARPSVGKTSFALSIARHAAVKSKIPVGLFSLEMSKEQLVDRLICAEANIDLWKLRTGRLSERDDDFPRIGQALGVLSKRRYTLTTPPPRTSWRFAPSVGACSPSTVWVSSSLTTYNSWNRAATRKTACKKWPRFRAASKQIARELQVPVLALSQLSRTVEMSKPAIPKLSHLRESGSIEQDADVVMFIYRKAADKNYRPEELSPEEKNLAELHIAKHRNGPTGIVKLYFEASRADFRSLERTMHAPPQPVAIR